MADYLSPEPEQTHNLLHRFVSSVINRLNIDPFKTTETIGIDSTEISLIAKATSRQGYSRLFLIGAHGVSFLSKLSKAELIDNNKLIDNQAPFENHGS